jgi:hypothetical protein
MKKNIILVFIALSNNLSNAQTGTNQKCWNTINTITTHWNSNQSLNSWNWTSEIFNDIYINNNPNHSFTSPFWATGSTNRNLPLFNFQVQTLANKKDFHPEDGWELLIKDFGNSSTANSGVTYPFFALYNRYTGKLRAYLMIPNQQESANSAVLKIAWSDNPKIGSLPSRKTSLFQFMKPIGTTTSNFDKNLAATSSNNYFKEDYFWLTAEFVVAYDPCTCHDYSFDNTTSKISFAYSMITELELNALLSGSLTQNVDEIINNNGPTGSDKNFSFSDLSQVKELVNSGQMAYSEWDGYKKDATEYLDKWSRPELRNKLHADILATSTYNLYEQLTKNIYEDNTEYWGVKTPNNFTNSPLNFDVMINEYGKTPNIIESNYSGIKTLASFLPYVGVAVAVYDLLIKDGQTNGPDVKAKPTVFTADLKLTGQISDENYMTAPTIFTPGSNTNLNLNYIPTYNNILGVFNVLEIPDMEYIKIPITNLTSVNGKLYQFKNEIKYVVNPASKMVVESVEAALVVHYTGSDKLYLDDNNLNKDQQQVAIPMYPGMFTPNDDNNVFEWDNSNLGNGQYSIANNNNLTTAVTSLDIYQNNGTGSKVGELTKRVISTDIAKYRIEQITENTNLNLENISPNYPQIISTTFNPKDHNEFIRFRTNYRPIGCKEELNICLTDHSNLPKVFLKFLVRLKHESNNNIEPLIMIFTLDVTDKMQSAIESTEQGSATKSLKSLNIWNNVDPANLSGYPGFKYELSKINLPSSVLNKDWFKNKNQVYNGESNLTVIGNLEIPDNSNIPDNSSIIAGGKINFGNNITTGNNSQIKSGIEIDLGSNTYNPTVIFEVIPFPLLIHSCQEYNYPNNKMTDEEIENICNKTSYKLKAIPNEPYQSNDFQDSVSESIARTIKLQHINPNPAHDVINVSVISDKDFVLKITNIAGQIMYEEKLFTKKSFVSKTINTSNYADGVYLVSAYGNSNISTLKLLIQH